MKTKITLLALLFSINVLFSQNWSINQFTQPLRFLAQEAYSFYDETPQLYYSRVEIDSTKYYNDTTIYYYSNDLIRDTCSFISQACFNKYSGSIFGSKSIEIPNENTKLIYRTDTFFINTITNINESWIFKNYNNGTYIEAKVVNIDTLHIYNGIDSVKYIELNLKNNSNNIISSYLNGTNIVLSKNNGIINIPDLRKITTLILEYLLKGKGYSPMTLGDIYNLNIGDEFQYFIEDFEGSPCDYGYTKYFNEKRLVLSKTYSNNYETVDYLLARTRSTAWTPNPFVYLNDTIALTINNLSDTIICDPYFHYNENSYLPNLACYKYNSCYVINPQSDGSNYYLEEYNDSLLIAQTPVKSSQNTKFFTPNLENTYIEGCGITIHHYFVCFSPTIYPYPFEKLIYYKKGTQEWGSPVYILEDKDITNKPAIKIHPNPSNGIFSILNNSNINKIEVYNSLGELIFSKNNIKTKQTTIDIQNKKAGIYFVMIFSENSYIARKLIKK